MSDITTDVGEIMLLRYMLNNMSPGNVQLHLFKNNITPNGSDVIGSYTESNEAGYSAVALLGSAWTFLTSSGTSTASYATQTLSFSTSASVYGYYLTNLQPGNTKQVIWAKKFDGAPYTIPTIGGNMQITPIIGAR